MSHYLSSSRSPDCVSLSVALLCAASGGLACSFEDVQLVPPAPRDEPATPATGEPMPVNEDVDPGTGEEPLVDEDPLSGGPSEQPLWPRLSGPIDTGEQPPESLGHGGPAVAAPCGKVDFLFVVDNSPSMEAQQQVLAAAFPGFVAGVEAALGSRDFHVMSVDTDDSSLRDRIGVFFSADECDTTLGAGRRRNAQGTDCGVLGEQRYLLSGQPDLGDAFSCIADVGDNGDLVERPMDAVLTALSTGFNEPTGCNAGFLREDSLLVVTLLTDEDDESSAGEPEDWRTELLARKAPQELVVLGLLADGSGLGCGLEASVRLSDFVEELPNGVVGDACDSDYGPAFAAVVERIATLCGEPPRALE